MTDKPMLLIIGTNSMALKMSKAALSSTGMEIVTSLSDYRELAKGIDSVKPAVVIILDTDNEDDVLGFVRKWENSGSRPFFIVTTGYCNIFRVLDEHLPGYAYPVLEPADMKLITKLIYKVIREKFSFDPV